MADNNAREIFDILAKHSEGKPDTIQLETTLDSMGIDSLALIEIIFELEERFDIAIPDPRATPGIPLKLETVGDVVLAVNQLISE